MASRSGEPAPKKLKFLRPSEDHSWKEDKPDIDVNKETTFIFNPSVALSLHQQRQRLPIATYRDHIIYLLEKYQTLVLVGETGSGKSTQIPQYLAEAGWASDGKIIGVTEPRRVAVTTLATRVADETGTILGDEIGYSIRFDEKFDPKVTKIKYMTEGLLIREMMGDPLLRQYCVLMLDEIHERTLNGDILMGLVRKILKKRKDLKLIVSSATADASFMKDYFNLANDKESKSKDESTSVCMTVSGRTFPCEIFYAADPIPDYVKESVNIVMQIHEHEEPGDVLVFLTGQEEVDTCVSMLAQQANMMTKAKMKLLILPMYGALPHRDQLAVFRHPPAGTRKVVVATNIAETSITITGIVYVVDCGFIKMKWFNPETFTDALVVVPISKASATQRAGRAGRTQSGKVYRLYQESEFEKLDPAAPPEIQRSDLCQPILQLKALGINDIVHFKFASPPSAKNMLCAVELLYALGALDKDGNLTTPLGEQIAEFPLPPMLSKMLLASQEYHCSEEILTIVSMLQVESVFINPFGQIAAKARAEKRKFEVGEGDLITLLNVYNGVAKSANPKQFCHQHFLNYKAIKRAQELRKQMSKMITRFGVPLESASEYSLRDVVKCIVAGLFANAVYLHYSGNYRTVRGEQVVYIHPTSVLYAEIQPQWILFNEILHTNQLYIRDLTVIEPEWLEEIAPHFYKKTVDRSYGDASQVSYGVDHR